MKKTITTLLLVLICGMATAQINNTKTLTDDSFASFMSKKPHVSFLQTKSSGTCEASCFASFQICLNYRPAPVCYKEINQCLGPCP